MNDRLPQNTHLVDSPFYIVVDLTIAVIIDSIARLRRFKRSTTTTGVSQLFIDQPVAIVVEAITRFGLRCSRGHTNLLAVALSRHGTIPDSLLHDRSEKRAHSPLHRFYRHNHVFIVAQVGQAIFHTNDVITGITHHVSIGIGLVGFSTFGQLSQASPRPSPSASFDLDYGHLGNCPRWSIDRRRPHQECTHRPEIAPEREWSRHLRLSDSSDHFQTMSHQLLVFGQPPREIIVPTSFLWESIGVRVSTSPPTPISSKGKSFHCRRYRRLRRPSLQPTYNNTDRPIIPLNV